MKAIDLSSLVSWLIYLAGFSYEYNADFPAFSLMPDCAAVMLAAIAIFLIIVVALQKYMGIPARSRSFGEPCKLVTTGPFRWTRNPIYVAFLIPIAALAWVSPGIAACTVGIYIMAMNVLIIGREEQMLRQLFGIEYERYCERTPRWLIA